MPDPNSKLPQQTAPDPASRPVGWLIDPDRGQLLPLAGIWILALDWLLFSSNLVTAGLATPIVMAIGFILGGGGTLILQKWIARGSALEGVCQSARCRNRRGSSLAAGGDTCRRLGFAGRGDEAFSAQINA